MTRTSMWTIGIAIWLAVLGGVAFSAQDKYTVKVPGGLAFSEFRGYEAWQAVSLSSNEKVVAVILGNPETIKAYKAGIPANGKPFPDGAKMAKIHWTRKLGEPFHKATVPGQLVNVGFMVKDAKRFAESGGWGYAGFDYDDASLLGWFTNWYFAESQLVVDGTKLDEEFTSRLVPLGRVLHQEFLDDLLDGDRDRGIDSAQAWNRARQMANRGCGRCLAKVRHTTGEQLKQDNSHAVQVGTDAGLLSGANLGGQIGRHLR